MSLQGPHELFVPNRNFWEDGGMEGPVTSVAYRDLEITSGAIQ